MTPHSTVPITITEEAAARIAELRMQDKLDLLVEEAQRRLPGIHEIEVRLEYAPWAWDEPRIIIEAFRPFLGVDKEGSLRQEFRTWEVETQPLEVLNNFLVISDYHYPNERPSLS